MKVGFFRHGIAVPHGTPGVAESERPLTPEGRKKAAQAAKGLRRLDLGFDAIYTSPLPRALQTAEILSEVLRLPRPKLLESLRPGTAARHLLGEIGDLRAKIPLLVGHEPMLSASISLAISGSVKASIDLKKSGFAFLEVEKDDAPVRGALLLLLTHAALRQLGS